MLSEFAGDKEDAMKLHIYLFRHGQTTYNEHGWFTGWIDAHMTTQGYRNARKIAEKLKRKHIDVAYHTSLSRSKETLKEVLKYHPECRKIVQDDRLIERCYGNLEGRSHQALQNEVKKDVLAVIERRYGMLPPAARKRFGTAVALRVYELFHRSYDIPPPGGESLKDVEKRVTAFIQVLLKKMKSEHVHVAISAHGNSMRPFRRYFERLSVEEMLQLENPYDKYFEYTVEA